MHTLWAVICKLCILGLKKMHFVDSELECKRNSKENRTSNIEKICKLSTFAEVWHKVGHKNYRRRFSKLNKYILMLHLRYENKDLNCLSGQLFNVMIWSQILRKRDFANISKAVFAVRRLDPK